MAQQTADLCYDMNYGMMDEGGTHMGVGSRLFAYGFLRGLGMKIARQSTTPIATVPPSRTWNYNTASTP